MLGRMFGTDGDGRHDRLTDFSRPVSGGYYFAPPLNLLLEMAISIGDAETAELTAAGSP